MPRILLVDDEPRVIEGLKLSLRKQDYLVLSATSGEEALTLLEKEPEFDVIISDERMLGMRGTELLKICYQKWPNTARIVLTGQADTDSAVRAINESRVFRFLKKPCSPNDLLNSIQDAIAERRVHASRIELLDAVKNHLTIETGTSAPQVPTPKSTASANELNPLFPGLSDDERRLVSKREMEVLRALYKGLRATQIAQSLFISPHTVRNHLKSLYRKLGVNSQHSLLDYVLTPRKAK